MVPYSNTIELYPIYEDHYQNDDYSDEARDILCELNNPMTLSLEKTDHEDNLTFEINNITFEEQEKIINKIILESYTKKVPIRCLIENYIPVE